LKLRKIKGLGFTPSPLFLARFGARDKMHAALQIKGLITIYIKRLINTITKKYLISLFYLFLTLSFIKMLIFFV
jgi:hypothetical protein